MNLVDRSRGTVPNRVRLPERRDLREDLRLRTIALPCVPTLAPLEQTLDAAQGLAHGPAHSLGRVRCENYRGAELFDGVGYGLRWHTQAHQPAKELGKGTRTVRSTASAGVPLLADVEQPEEEGKGMTKLDELGDRHALEQPEHSPLILGRVSAPQSTGEVADLGKLRQESRALLLGDQTSMGLCEEVQLFSHHTNISTGPRHTAADDRLEHDVMAVARLDRLARSLVHMARLGEALRALGVDLVSLREGIDTDTSTGRALFGMCGAFAQLEADLVRERTVAGPPRRPQARRAARVAPDPGRQAARPGAAHAR